MRIKINNEYEFSFLEDVSINEFHNHLVEKSDTYNLLINKLEDYERTFTDFNSIDVVKVSHKKPENQLLLTIKVNNLLAYNSNSFYYKYLLINS